MFKKILIAAMALSLLGVMGCSLIPNSTTTTSSAGIKTIREAEINPGWAMKQLEISTSDEVSIVLTLSNGDKVDGYFYLEKGDEANFRIAGESLIYKSQVTGEKIKYITSDRFSFTASLAQGNAYYLTIGSSSGEGEQSKVTVFLELVYPASGSIYIPIGTK